jgi:hypothetical protein
MVFLERLKYSAKKKNMKKINQRFSNILLLLFIFLLPTQFGKHFFLDFSYISGLRVDYLSYALYTTDIFSLLLIFLYRSDVIKLFKNKLVSSILFLLTLSIFFSISPWIAFYKFLKIVQIVALFAVFRNIFINKLLLIYAFISGALLQLGLSIYQIVNHKSIQGLFYFLGERYFTSSMPGIAKASLQGIEILRPYGTFSHPNSMAGFYLLVYALILGIDFKKNYILKSSLLFLCVSIILISFSKTAILGLIIVNIVALINNYKKALCKFCAFARVFVLSLISLIFLQSTTDPLSLIKRGQLLKNSISIISNYPITGVGVGNYLVAQSQLIGKNIIFPPQPVHNIFLLLISEVGLLLGGAIIFYLFKYFYKFQRFNVLIYCAIVIIICGFFDHYWITLQQNMLLLGLVFGIIANPQARFEKSR